MQRSQVPSETDSGFRNLRVWQSAFALAEIVYRETASFPSEERYGMTSQMRRCAISAVANIAEGKGRYGTRQFVAFLDIAHGSLRELQALVLLAVRLNLLGLESQATIDEAISRTIGQLLRLAQHLRRVADKSRRTVD